MQKAMVVVSLLGGLSAGVCTVLSYIVGPMFTSAATTHQWMELRLRTGSLTVAHIESADPAAIRAAGEGFSKYTAWAGTGRGSARRLARFYERSPNSRIALVWRTLKVLPDYEVNGYGVMVFVTAISLPLWIPTFLGGVYPVYLLARRMRKKYRGMRGRCAECGYNLTGNISGRCPECGCATPWRESRGK